MSTISDLNPIPIMIMNGPALGHGAHARDRRISFKKTLKSSREVKQFEKFLNDRLRLTAAPEA